MSHERKMFLKTFELLLRISVLVILVGCEDQLSNVPEEKSTGEEYFAIFKNLALFLEYLTTNFFADQVQILEKDYEEKMAEIEGHGTDEVLPFEYRKYDRVALTPEDVAEQILKVEHELEEYNDNGEL